MQKAMDGAAAGTLPECLLSSSERMRRDKPVAVSPHSFRTFPPFVGAR
jgi:hypothetical protein